MKSRLILGLLLVACSENPFDPNGLRRLPASAIHEDLHLSRNDENQIYRLVYRASSQRISSVTRDKKTGVISVSCGGDDVWENGVPRLNGDYFQLKKTGSTWRIIDKGWWMR